MFQVIEIIFDCYKFLNSNGERQQKNQNRYLNQVNNIVSSHLNDHFWNSKRQNILDKELLLDIKKRKNPVILAKRLIDE